MAKAKRKKAKAKAKAKPRKSAGKKPRQAKAPRIETKKLNAAAPRAHHDMGGLKAGKVKPSEHDFTLWEKRVDAMMVLLSDKKRGLMNTDMLRRGIESLPPDAYDRMSYYERWIHSIATMMLERGVVTRAELDARIARLRKRAAP